MASNYTLRLTAVVRAAVLVNSNLASRDVDNGGDAWTVPLRVAGDATNTIRAYWCGWQMTPAQAQNLRDRLIARGLLGAEVRVVDGTEKGTFVFDPTARAYIFDGREGQWTPTEVLAALGLARLQTAQP